MNEQEIIADAVLNINKYFNILKNMDIKKVNVWCSIEDHIIFSVDECNRLYDIEVKFSKAQRLFSSFEDYNKETQDE